MPAATIHPLDAYVVAPPAGPDAATYVRRRLVVGLGAAALLLGLVAGGRAVAAFGDDPASVPERRPVPATYVVQPGDTLWSIARDRADGPSVPALAAHLARLNGGANLHVGQRVVLP